MKAERILRPRKFRPRKRLRPFTVIRCPFNGHQVSFCRGLCTPIQGRGHCGRLAAHAMRSRAQRAIAEYNTRKAGTG